MEAAGQLAFRGQRKARDQEMEIMVDKMMKSRLPPLTAEESVEVSIKLCRFLGESLRPDILLHAVLIFLEIARAYQRGMAKKGIGAARPRDVGIEMVELQKRVGLSSSAISRSSRSLASGALA